MSEKSDSDPLLKKYVRVKRVINDQFVEFDFAIGDPEIFVELVLPKAAFSTFCEQNNTITMSDAQGEEIDREMEKWRYGKDTLVSNNRSRN